MSFGASRIFDHLLTRKRKASTDGLIARPFLLPRDLAAVGRRCATATTKKRLNEMLSIYLLSALISTKFTDAALHFRKLNAPSDQK